MSRIINIASFLLISSMVTAPAMAGRIVTTPAPVAGLGVGAVALLGMGYRALKRRSTK